MKRSMRCSADPSSSRSSLGPSLPCAAVTRRRYEDDATDVDGPPDVLEQADDVLEPSAVEQDLLLLLGEPRPGRWQRDVDAGGQQSGQPLAMASAEQRRLPRRSRLGGHLLPAVQDQLVDRVVDVRPDAPCLPAPPPRRHERAGHDDDGRLPSTTSAARSATPTGTPRSQPTHRPRAAPRSPCNASMRPARPPGRLDPMGRCTPMRRRLTTSCQL
jgi:hypothetical protein